MKWKKREKMLRELRRRNRGLKTVVSLPSLRCEGPKYPSLSATGVAPIVDRVAKHEPPPGVIVDTLHKQGMMVLSRDELPWAGGRKP